MTPGTPSVSATSGEPDPPRRDLDRAGQRRAPRRSTGYKLQYKKTPDGGWTAGPQGPRPASAPTIIDLDQDTSYEVQVQATNDDGVGAWSEHRQRNAPTPTTRRRSPTPASPEPSRRLIGDAAVQTAADIGAAVTAMDDDNDTLTYSLVEGTDAAEVRPSFSTSGQIRTKAGAAVRPRDEVELHGHRHGRRRPAAARTRSPSRSTSTTRPSPR